MPDVEFDRGIFNPAFYPYLETDYEYEIYAGGAGSGKSQFIIQKSLYKCLKSKKYRQVFCRKTAKSISGSTFLMYKDTINMYGLNSLFKIKESTHDIECINGNMMLSYGLDDADKIKSIATPTDIWVEELLGKADSPPITADDFDQLDLRLRGSEDQETQFIISFNPVNEESWIKQRFHTDRMLNDRIEASKIPNTLIHWSTYKDNKFIDQKAYETKLDRMAENNPNFYRIYRLGKWGREITGQEYYGQFRYEKHVSFTDNYRPGVALHISFDQNAIPYNTAIVMQVVKEPDNTYTINVLKEFCIEPPYNTTEEVCNVITAFYGDKLKDGLFIYGDASGRRTDTRGKESDYQIIEKVFAKHLHNGSNRVCRANPPHKTRNDFMNKLLSGHFPVKVQIHSECRNLIKDLETIKVDVDFGKLKQTEKNTHTGKTFEKVGHTSDAFDYFCAEAFKQYYQENKLTKLWR